MLSRSIFTILVVSNFNLFQTQNSTNTLGVVFKGVDVFLFSDLFDLINEGRIAEDYKIKKDDVAFYLYTNFHLDGIRLTTDNLEQVNASLPTKVVVHGWKNSHQTDWVEEISHSYLKKGNYNVIRVDWSGPADLDLDDAAQTVPNVGIHVGTFISQLPVLLEDIHMIGHSYGAHVAGFAGKTVQNITGSKIARITGLDPAGIHFGNVSDTSQNLYKEDAQLVDAIHTDAGNVGIVDPVGVIDFYPNGGVRPQPGCLNNDQEEACSHLRAAWLFAEEVEKESGFVATKCSSEADFRTGKCKDNVQISMGSELDGSKEGTYYLTTNAKYPFSLE